VYLEWPSSVAVRDLRGDDFDVPQKAENRPKALTRFSA
jgi:hypothetical protein